MRTPTPRLQAVAAIDQVQRLKVKLGERAYTPSEISAIILRDLYKYVKNIC